ncbi:MAG: tRNA (adenosine(37)-N6)-dimethylallyltransferase MiaA [Candidatus Saccharimonadota bacterium]
MAPPVEYKEQRPGKLPLVVIVGPTASGKSSLAMKIARKYDGEIICADSRTVYKNMDIGTAKPSKKDQAEIPHWGLDLVEPGERFTAADFKKYAEKAIETIRQNGKLPILVGGTGLYVDGVIFDYQFVETDLTLRKELESLSLEELKEYCANNNVNLPENENNRRYVVRAIEQKNTSATRLNEPITNSIIVGIATEPSLLRDRIEHRAEQLFETGMVEEAKMLGEKYGWNSEAMTGNIYKLVKEFVDGQFDEAELKQRNAIADWQLAKRQITWLKRNPFIHWVALDDAFSYIASRLGGSQ